MRRVINIMILIFLSTMAAQGQIKIGGNVYGGGNKGSLGGSSSVTVKSGDLNMVFGGARQANVGGNAYVNIDGKNATGYSIINYVFGGNDIGGNIGTLAGRNAAVSVAEHRALPEGIAGNADGVDDTWNTYVHLSTKMVEAVTYTQDEVYAYNAALPGALTPGTPLTAAQAEAYNNKTEGATKQENDELSPEEANAYNAKLTGAVAAGSTKTPAHAADDNQKIFIGQAFAGGNGDYDYVKKENGLYDVYKKSHGSSDEPLSTNVPKPEVDKAYLDVQGGTIDYAYGGGNNVTVREKTVIHVDNPSEVVTDIFANVQGVEDLTATSDNIGTEGHEETRQLLSAQRIKEMGINAFFSYIESATFQMGRLFGGNNTAEMSIRPTWNLQSGMIRNLYSGGNKGTMTSPEGLLLEINPLPTNTLPLVVDNVYGGCRMADVMPTVNGKYTPCTNLQDKDEHGELIYKFPDVFSARVLVRGGDINNVYGGNDVTGTVYGGNAIGIYTSIRGDVYGGGNGAYPYTNLKDDETYGDLFFGQGGNFDDLNAYRPNAEQVSIRLKGNGPGDFTIIKGSVYLGGNCASIDTKDVENRTVELKMGSYVIADKVFLGNNGEKMLDEDYLKLYADQEFFTDVLSLKDENNFANYMQGVAMTMQPSVVFDKASKDPSDYIDNTSYVGSFYCGGNVGSMIIPGTNTYRIDRRLNIFDKFVGGCNNADVPASDYNAEYRGGVLGSVEEQVEDADGYTMYYKTQEGNKKKIKDRLVIELDNLTITPLRWNDTFTPVDKKLTKGKTYYYDAEGTASFPATGDEPVDGKEETTKYYEKVGDSYVLVTPLTKGKEYYYTDLRSSRFIADGTEYTDLSDPKHTYYELTERGEQPIWNTAEWDDDKDDFMSVKNSEVGKDTRLLGGNVYGGCYSSGHVNGNVIININEEMLNRDNVFGKGSGIYGRPASGVDLEEQRGDLNAVALSVFGAGFGKDTEIWGSTTVNLNKGYAFQIFGGGEKGVVGKKKTFKDEHGQIAYRKYVFNPDYSSTVNLKGNSPVDHSEVTEDDPDDLAETEFIYGGGNEGDVCGNTYVNLGKGRIYDAFGGACNADILGHTETYIGRQPNASDGFIDGFPWIKDIIYGGNDFGGTIYGEFETGYDFTKRLRDYDHDIAKIHRSSGEKANDIPNVLKGASYVEYLQGHVDSIFGGGYGYYDYNDKNQYGDNADMPKLPSSFVNIRAQHNSKNAIKGVFGGGTGYPGYRKGDKGQERSYVLIDIPKNEEVEMDEFKTLQVFGSGSYNGVGMGVDKDKLADGTINLDQASAIIDLLHGKIGNVYGGSYNEGVTRRTVVNVPEESTIWMYSTEVDFDDPPTNQIKHVKEWGNIFGGAYGNLILPPCDVYESNVNYRSSDAIVNGSIFGGNNSERRTLYAKVNIYSPVWSREDKAASGYLANVYGAGQGEDTWSEHTEVNLEAGAQVYEVYGGGMMGHVLNVESVQRYMNSYLLGPSDEISNKDPFWKDSNKWDIINGVRTVKQDWKAKWDEDWADAWTLGDYYSPNVDSNNDGIVDSYNYETYISNAATNLSQIAERPELSDKTALQLAGTKKYNANVIIKAGAYVGNYAYGGGYGKSKAPLSGDVYGTTYVALLGGTVKKDIYAAGTSGGVYDVFGAKNFTASSNAFIKGGTLRNVFGGGWEGPVGYHSGEISDSPVNDIPGATHLVIGLVGSDSTLTNMPVIRRSVYGGGEGGLIVGTAHLTINNGFIGYKYENESGKTYTYNKDHFVENLLEGTEDMEGSGNAFGGGYVVNSYVDKTKVEMLGGTIRGSLYGGGELGPIGRGTKLAVNNDNNNDEWWKPLKNDEATIYRPGHTLVKMFNGHVLRNVFGGGRGKNTWGNDGTLYMKPEVVATLDLSSKGAVFGQTEVFIHGGEVGTAEEMVDATVTEKNGNVFGGGDEGFVYSAYEECGKFFVGMKSGKRYNEGIDPTNVNAYNYQGYYYKNTCGNTLTDDDQAAIGYTSIDAGTGFLKKGNDRIFTEDCKVVVEPWLEAKSAISESTFSCAAGDYVPISYLNTLPKKNEDSSNKWNSLDVGTVTIDDNNNITYNERGVIIHNAVFAGGNIALGTLNANTNTVFGNATASINDVYNRDFVTIGTGNTGGLYGDGNLTLVDGYRELNITNYGTDFYNIDNPQSNQISYDQYLQLLPREQAYYEVKYKCVQTCKDIEKTSWSEKSTLPEDELRALFLDPNGVPLLADGTLATAAGQNTVLILVNGKWMPNPDFWVQNGVVTNYAGRIMNTIQRADFCGVFGSRMVMKGAPDRVPEHSDYSNYTINRVREVSLNKKQQSSDSYHGNYFGIYSNVNFLGALTSDVNFHEAVRTTNATDNGYQANGTTTYEQWKENHKTERKRNNGTSYNKLALASGVHLEITTELSTGNTLDEKDWGPITGVVELDLINVQPGIGGGFVYAQNIHGTPKDMREVRPTTTLSTFNENAATKWDYDYIETNDALTGDDAVQKEWETSGNFVNSSVNQPIIDDCYNESGRYLMGNRVKAHYWFIHGQVYVYDQYISAYTGAPNAYSETVEIPLNFIAASNGKMKLIDVQPNLYAFYSSKNANAETRLTADSKIVINETEYHLNDPISYWDWCQLPSNLQNLFEKDTYVVKEDCKVGKKTYTAGTVLLRSEYEAASNATTPQQIEGKDVAAVIMMEKNEDGELVVAKDENNQEIYLPFDDIFNSSNNMSHDTGFLLTYKVNNPKLWDQWYTKESSAAREKDQAEHESGWLFGPTYHPTTPGLYGQSEHQVGDIITDEVYTNYDNISKDSETKGYIPTSGQATFERAYITKEYVEASMIDPNDPTKRIERHLQEGAKLAKSEFDATEWAKLNDDDDDENDGDKVAKAFICTSTIMLSDNEFIFQGDLMTEAQKNAYHDRFSGQNVTSAEAQIANDIEKLIVPAYYCTTEGLYGGDVYDPNKNYRARETWSSMSESERENFEFNYDALDLLIDPDYTCPSVGDMSEGKKYQYDSKLKTLDGAEANAAHYSLREPIDYTATYLGTEALMYTPDEGSNKTPATGQTQVSTADYPELTRTEFESLPNEQHYYAPITVNETDVAEGSHTVYVVHNSFVHSEISYAVGSTIDSKIYNERLSDDEKQNVTPLTFTTAGTYYYCREAYTVNKGGAADDAKPVMAIMDNSNGKNSDGQTVSITKNQTIGNGKEVPVGFIIAQGASASETYSYKSLPNKQLNFTIHGVAPMETSTLYVSRYSDIDDLSKEKIITVIYQYDYEESDSEGAHITPISERHVLNIHIKFDSGIPIIDDIHAPGIVLPGTAVTLTTPRIHLSGEDLLDFGWLLYENEEYAKNRTNGVKYTPSEKLYWYQDGYYVAYFAKTLVGNAFSNCVPVSVANYHDLKAVMDDKVNHLHVDYDRTRLKRNSKIYINDYSESNENGLDLFKSFYDLSVLDTSPTGVLDNDGLVADGTLKGHTPLNTSEAEGVNIFDNETYQKGVKAGTNLEFFLRTDIDHSGPSGSATWTPIASGSSDPCFNGTFHGDGHTISGLDNSLFKNLCGEVYNLGVTGSFSGAGLVETGNGYVENTWISTSSTAAKTSKPVFGTPSRTEAEIAAKGSIQIVNSYYQEEASGVTNPYTEHSGNYGVPTRKSAQAFYNGEVAYDLNGFYLYKRYNDHQTPGGTPLTYSYFEEDGEGNLQRKIGKYAENTAYCSSGYDNVAYVEDRFFDGDFRYAAGTIPTWEDERHYTEEVTDENNEVTIEDRFAPIWPDDYIFFGQKLTFGYDATPTTHQELPTAVVRGDNGRLAQTVNANRVYRAPAYYRSKDMGVFHFNPNAYLAAKEKLSDERIEQLTADNIDPSTVIRDAYPGMTAVDFAGHDNTPWGMGSVSSGSAAGTKWFYPPLLDDDGLLSITNCDETQNLLVYAPAESSANGYFNAATYDVLNRYFKEPVFNEYYDRTNSRADQLFTDGKVYDRVYDATGEAISGHLVQSDLTATNDHLLVDKEDFNAPFAYTFGADYLMWYQRRPADNEYVDISKGWQGISLPFTAKLATTNQKGEITHFFEGSTTGHEYWLRKLEDISSETGSDVLTANFIYPEIADGSTISKTVSNTFLWDYFYKNEDLHNQKDANDDTYLKYRQYYNTSRTYDPYPQLTAAKPYLLGLPGVTYYEFDLSDQFMAKNTAVDIPKLGKQTITFASTKGATINVSDNEIAAAKTANTKNGFTFMPTYMSQTLKAVQADNDGKPLSSDTTPKSYVINTDGNAYDIVTWNKDTDAKEATVVPFRPYFIEAKATTARQTRSIVFSNMPNGSLSPDAAGTGEPGTLSVAAGRKKIVVSSDLKEAATVQILNTAGQALAEFDIQPGETIETRVNLSGVYIVQSTDAHFTKKLSVR